MRKDPTTTTLLLGGDVMTGRGIDHILPHPGDPRLFEPWSTSALDYVSLAERRHGPLPRRVDPAYIWGDALTELAAVDRRIVNLETAVTSRGAPEPKGINYRMHPANVACLTAARIDLCVLANNHVLDWGPHGLADTLDTLAGAGIATVGAGRDAAAAWAPAILPGERRLVAAAAAAPSSGVPSSWAATGRRPGVAFLGDLSERAAAEIGRRVGAVARPGDLVVVSLHWGPNWGYDVPAAHVAFAHDLVRLAGADVVFGHSSHHPLGIEVVDGSLVLYGCGDLLDDYEGIGGHEEYRPDLSVLYVPTFSETGLVGLDLVPLRIRRFRLERASDDDAAWLRDILAREGRRFGTSVESGTGGRLALRA